MLPSILCVFFLPVEPLHLNREHPRRSLDVVIGRAPDGPISTFLRFVSSSPRPVCSFSPPPDEKGDGFGSIPFVG